MIIDSDTHIDETDATWEHMAGADLAYKPVTEYSKGFDPARQDKAGFRGGRYWLIDGRRQLRRFADDARTQTTAETRELIDVQARLAHMDRLGVDIQVIYPTLFLAEATERVEVQAAIRKSYNRWMAERCALSGGRLRWVMLPVLDSAGGVEELRFAKANGACGVLKKGDREAGHWVSEEYFFPLYEEAQRLDLPICFHLGSGQTWLTPREQLQHSVFLHNTLPIVHGFHGLLLHGVPSRFPALRFGFIEAGASWIPYVVYDLKRKRERLPELSAEALDRDSPQDMLRANRMYVTCQVDEDLPYLMRYTGQDALLAGSDYSHADAAKELDFSAKLRERVALGRITETARRKITFDNPKALYGL
ncbi:MAG TPA: amidohydrolase family protein [Burkholderiales bacterium]|nr:amidohydrolase family protein [Burkholderiales bacterium]